MIPRPQGRLNGLDLVQDRRIGDLVIGGNAPMFMPGDWRATVASPSKNGWLIYRDPNAKDQEGWKAGSKLIQEHGSFLPLDAWGATVIGKAANGSIDESKANRYWYAAKVNLHLHNQVNLPSSSDGGEDVFG